MTFTARITIPKAHSALMYYVSSCFARMAAKESALETKTASSFLLHRGLGLTAYSHGEFRLKRCASAYIDSESINSIV
jgi:hypothetical protein